MLKNRVSLWCCAMAAGLATAAVGCRMNHATGGGAIEAVSHGNNPRVLFIGSSSIAYWKTLGDDFADFPGTILRDGVGGRTLHDVVYHVQDEIIAEHPNKVFVYAGSLDLHGKNERPVADVFDDWVGLCDAVHATLPNTTVYFISCKPSIAKWNEISSDEKLNTLVKAMAEREKDVVYIDTFSAMLDTGGQPLPEYFNPKDHNHLNKEGYALWTKLIRPYLFGPAASTAPAVALR
jgi:lysophospholipase L1-like esterase